MVFRLIWFNLDADYRAQHRVLRMLIHGYGPIQLNVDTMLIDSPHHQLQHYIATPNALTFQVSVPAMTAAMLQFACTTPTTTGHAAHLLPPTIPRDATFPKLNHHAARTYNASCSSFGQQRRTALHAFHSSGYAGQRFLWFLVSSRLAVHCCAFTAARVH